jgi:ethanolamine utilization protein EutJ
MSEEFMDRMKREDNMNSDFEFCNTLVRDFVESMEKPNKPCSKKLLTGVDLGTAYIVISVMDEEFHPICGAYRYANVVKDGLVVDYMGAVKIVKELKKEVEAKIGVELLYAAAAIPPGTSVNDNGAVKHVLESAGFEVTGVLDEPTAANSVLRIQNGAVVDVGGGTTGISIFENGQVVYTGDEATGGTHFSLVLAGNYKISYDEAESIKKDVGRHKEIGPILRPVVQKVASIIERHIENYNISDIYLVGGTCCLEGIEEIIESELSIPTFKPTNPFFVTPLGIAMNCKAV